MSAIKCSKTASMPCAQNQSSRDRATDRTHSPWVALETLPAASGVVPEHARRRYFYKANWSEPQVNKTV
jgi:hypothetical protein